jgi:hypothetical protein
VVGWVVGHRMVFNSRLPSAIPRRLQRGSDTIWARPCRAGLNHGHAVVPRAWGHATGVS